MTKEFEDAVADLLHAIACKATLSDAAMEALVEAEPSPANRKCLIVGLKALELITDEQAAFAIAYRWPLRGA